MPIKLNIVYTDCAATRSLVSHTRTSYLPLITTDPSNNLHHQPNNRSDTKNMGMTARCQCSLVKFTTPIPKPLRLHACHCTECRHQSSAAFGLTAIFPYFELPEPVSELVGSYTRLTLSGREMECLFCKNCGARLLHRFRDVVPAPGERPGPTATVNVKGGCLEGLDREMMKTAVHIWTRHAVVDIPEGVEAWEGAPPRANPLEG